MCRVNTFCCGCSLKASAITAAVFTVLSAISFIAVGIQVMAIGDWLSQDSPTGQTGLGAMIGPMLNYGQTSDTKQQTTEQLKAEWNKNKEDRLAVAQICKIAGGVLLGVGAITLIVFICLCCAVSKRNPCLLMPYLICAMVKILLNLAAGVYVIIRGAYLASPYFLIQMAFDLYLWVCVKSYRDELQENGSVYPAPGGMMMVEHY